MYLIQKLHVVPAQQGLVLLAHWFLTTSNRWRFSHVVWLPTEGVALLPMEHLLVLSGSTQMCIIPSHSGYVSFALEVVAHSTSFLYFLPLWLFIYVSYLLIHVYWLPYSFCILRNMINKTCCQASSRHNYFNQYIKQMLIGFFWCNSSISYSMIPFKISKQSNHIFIDHTASSIGFFFFLSFTFSPKISEGDKWSCLQKVFYN